MFETPDTSYTMLSDSSVTLPLYSLYSKTREPTDQQLAAIDTLIVDLLDIGCRIYTYMYTLAACMRAAARLGKSVLLLDRPNPLGLCHKDASGRWLRVRQGLFVLADTVEVEGNVMDLTYKSFVGEFAIPIRHGLTLGELGQLFISLESLKLNYRVITVHGLRRSLKYAASQSFY